MIKQYSIRQTLFCLETWMDNQSIQVLSNSLNLVETIWINQSYSKQNLNLNQTIQYTFGLKNLTLNQSLPLNQRVGRSNQIRVTENLAISQSIKQWPPILVGNVLVFSELIVAHCTIIHRSVSDQLVLREGRSYAYFNF